MLRTVIVDDEPKGRLVLLEKLKAHCPNVDIVGQAADGAEAITLIESLCPDLVFLDIEMPQVNGFELLNRLKGRSFHLIFTTAYDQYAIRAFKYSAFDYLLKPIDIQELKDAVAKIDIQKQQQLKVQIQLLQEHFYTATNRIHKLAVSTIEGVLLLDVQNIVRLEAISNYTRIFMTNKTKIVASKTLKEFRELLPAGIFFRTHQSHIVNLNFVKKYIKGDGGQVELNDGNLIEVSRKNKDELMKILGLF